MTKRVEEKVDRTDWPAGEWDNEPDYLSWTDEATGLPCLVVRGPMGALCGYTGVPPGHPAYGKEADTVDAQVHGGLTYASKCNGSVCHDAPEGEDDVWWLGFDCAHAWDVAPRMIAQLRKAGMSDSAFHFYGRDSVYRNVAYVKEECRLLAEYLAKETSHAA